MCHGCLLVRVNDRFDFRSFIFSRKITLTYFVPRMHFSSSNPKLLDITFQLFLLFWVSYFQNVFHSNRIFLSWTFHVPSQTPLKNEKIIFWHFSRCVILSKILFWHKKSKAFHLTIALILHPWHKICNVFFQKCKKKSIFALKSFQIIKTWKWTFPRRSCHFIKEIDTFHLGVNVFFDFMRIDWRLN